MKLYYLDFFDLTTKNFNPNRGDFPDEEPDSGEEYSDDEEEEINEQANVQDKSVENLTEKLEKV